MRTVLTAAAAAALIAALASPAVAAPTTEAGTPSSNAAGTANLRHQGERDATAPLTCSPTAEAAANGPRNPWPRSATR